MPAVLSCFADQDSRVRYYTTEALYNIGKVAKGEILLYFNEIFDALCKLSADSELSVKNGAELLDRLIKDIVSEKATSYASVVDANSEMRSPTGSYSEEIDVEVIVGSFNSKPMAFSLEKFIPLLAERIYVVNPFTRMFLVSWITVLNSVPDLDLVTYFPKFAHGLFKFLNDTHHDVRTATGRVLDEFLIEIKSMSDLKEHKLDKDFISHICRTDLYRLKSQDHMVRDQRGFKEIGSCDAQSFVQVDYSRLIEILLPHLSTSDESIQLTALRWISELFSISPLTMIRFTPKLLFVLLPALSHPSDPLRRSARSLNDKLGSLVLDGFGANHDQAGAVLISSTDKDTLGEKQNLAAAHHECRSDLLDFSATVNALTLQLLEEHEETRISALSWLMMLHQIAPRSILTLDDGTFPVLLKTLSDPSEEVVKQDLQLLAQISTHSETVYFQTLMTNLLTLFSTDRKLLDTRGSLIVRQLCYNLDPERIYRSLAEILEGEDDLEFASMMIQLLNNNLIVAPELLDLRKRLKRSEQEDGQALFSVMYKSWCHNAVATFSLCLLAQAYEQASGLLQIFAEFEVSVGLLVQVDKLVQLLESPVFTYLRLQLMEPESYPYLFKCLYGLLMLLPQSSAFTTLRNRLNCVSSIGCMHIIPKQSNDLKMSGGMKGKKAYWLALFQKFRSVQLRHEAASKQRMRPTYGGCISDVVAVE